MHNEISKIVRLLKTENVQVKMSCKIKNKSNPDVSRYGYFFIFRNQRQLMFYLQESYIYASFDRVTTPFASFTSLCKMVSGLVAGLEIVT